jgi:hypothetical protein
MTPELLSRSVFSDRALERDNETCVIPWCDADADEVHHVIERSLWSDGGYYLRNAASVCNPHHRYAEDNHIPPQAFWRWIGVEPLTPEQFTSFHINKWGDELDEPPGKDKREYIKYPSSRHFHFSHSRDRDDTEHGSVDPFLGVPLVTLVKMDGGNTIIVQADTKDDEPIRARNAKDKGRPGEKRTYSRLQSEYWNRGLNHVIPDHIQIFGEWLFAKHSIHYGCDCNTPCEDIGPGLDSYFQVFGVFDKRFDLWLGWPEVEQWAEKIGYPTAPVISSEPSSDPATFERSHQLHDQLVQTGQDLVRDGHEGFVVRSKFPFHYGQFPVRLGKYVRKNHVDDDAEHWSNQPLVPNQLKK